MRAKPPKYAYLLAVISGVAVFLIPAAGPIPVSLALALLFSGGLFGFAWPSGSWRWGLWIAGPLVVLVGFSVLFAGQVGVFLEKDLPLLLISVAAACLGSFASSRYRRRARP